MMFLRLNLFGTFLAQTGGSDDTAANTISFRSDKIRALLAYLAVENGRPHRREFLATLLWPEYADSDALHNLRTSLYRLRQPFDAELSEKLLTVDRQSTQVQRESLWLDVAQFQALLEACASHQHQARQNCAECMERLQAAVELYQGEFLAGFSLPDAVPFEEWLLVYRERFHQQTLAALHDLAAFHKQQGQYELAHKYAARQITLEPWREAGHRQLMQALALSGHLDDALAQFESCRRILAQELDTEPASETVALYEQIRDSQAAGQSFLTAVAPPDDVPAKPAYHLPRQFTQFIGRQDEIRTIIERLADPACALLTITGPGGIGKTRLAIEAARQQIGSYKHGVWFVSLASVRAVDHIPAAIAAGLPLPPFNSGNIERQILNYLSNKQLLLIIDNFEHILAGADFLLTLLRQAPQVKILTTSRQRLNLRAERVFEIQGLTIPTNEVTDLFIESYTAVQLFVQQLQQVRHSAILTEQDVEQIGRICQLVEGVPLAIELAINLTTTRSFDEIGDLIANDLDRLETRSQDVPKRQRSLRAVFDYSWDLLDEGEQQALRSVAVFPTSFTIEAAVEITDTTEQYLRALVEKSFLRRDENGRFEMHVLLRQFANEKLYETTTEQTIQHLKEQHSIYYLTFVQNHEANLHSPEGSFAIQKIRQEIDNIRFAWHWIVTQVDISAMAQNSLSLVSYFAISGQCREGERLFDLAIKSLDADTLAKRDRGVEKEHHRLTSYLLTRRVRLLVKLGEVTEAMAAIKLAVKHGQLAEDIDTQLEARLYWGTLFWRQGNYNAALEQSAIAQKLREHATAEVTKIRVIVQQGFLHYCQSNFTEARRCYEQALHDYKAIGYEGLVAIAVHTNLGSLSISEGKYAEARKHLGQALSMYIQIGALPEKGMTLASLSLLAFHEQHYSEALTAGHQALEIFQEIGEIVREGGVLLTLGNVYARLGQWETAKAYYERALVLICQVQNQNSEGEALMSLSLLACQLDDFQEALKLSGQALLLAEQSADRNLDAYTLTGQGRALAGMGQLGEAVDFYQEALAIRRELKQWHLAAEIEALLAQLHFDQDDLVQASAYVERVMAFLQLPDQQDGGERPFLKPGTSHNNPHLIRPLNGTQEPFQVYLTCYQVLAANGDKRSDVILNYAVGRLHEEAEQLENPDLQRALLENVPANRKLLSIIEGRNVIEHLAGNG